MHVHTETKELQWEYLSGAGTKSIVDNADNAKSDGRRRSSICIPPDQLVWAPSILHLPEWIEQA